MAWNNSRESTRAIYDALPILSCAQNIKIVTVKKTGDEKNKTALEHILPSLRRHGVSAEFDTAIEDNCPVVDILYSKIESYNADLCVLGCYGHSRMQEIIFGGVTSEILKSMPIPVLLSH